MRFGKPENVCFAVLDCQLEGGSSQADRPLRRENSIDPLVARAGHETCGPARQIARRMPSTREGEAGKHRLNQQKSRIDSLEFHPCEESASHRQAAK